MQTALADFIRETPRGREADAILRKCVHCGLCTATCPTYRLLGNELDSPRGRIYLIKRMLEGAAVGAATQLHLDRCLGCRACESTCPSGVEYGRLLESGKIVAEQNAPQRGAKERALRRLILAVVPHEKRFAFLLRIAQKLAPVLPHRLRAKIPHQRAVPAWPAPRHRRRMVMLRGCVQPAAAPAIDAAAGHLLDEQGGGRLGASGCCGGGARHRPAAKKGLALARKTIDACWPPVEQGAEAVVVSASGCAVTVKEYAHLLRDDPAYAEKARVVSSLARDLSEVAAALNIIPAIAPRNLRVAFHSPCTLQHGQKITGVVERLLEDAGYTVAATPNHHLCCGSAGTYSLLQPGLSRQLLKNKLHDLHSAAPDLIATANIGCLLHRQSRTATPVRHWVELL